MSEPSDRDTKPENKIAARCVQCDAGFTAAELLNSSGCPTCGTSSLPCDPSQDTTLRINWHELRILTIWASNYAQGLDPNAQHTLACILRRLEAQRPEGCVALTLAGEVRALQDQGVDVELKDGSGQPIVPRRPRN